MPSLSRRPRRGGLVLAGALSLAALAACSQPAGPEQTAQDFLRAMGSKDSATVCSLTAYGGKPLAGDDLLRCRSGNDALVNEIIPAELLAELRSATVTEAQVSGDSATIPEGQVSADLAEYVGQIALVRVDGRWYVDTEPDSQDDQSGPSSSPTTGTGTAPGSGTQPGGSDTSVP